MESVDELPEYIGVIVFMFVIVLIPLWLPIYAINTFWHTSNR